MKFLIATLLLIVTNLSFAQWTQTSAPATTITWSLLGSGQTIFAGTQDDGVLRSTDAGSNWTSTNLDVSRRHTYALGLNGTTVFAGTDSGLYRSTDNGLSWQSPTALVGKAIESVRLTGSSWFAGTDGSGIYKSTDNGSSWPAASTGLTDNYVHTIVSDGSTLYAGLSNGICYSTDTGSTWNLLANGNGLYPNVRAFATANGSLFAGGASGIQRSTDGGTTWVAVDSGLTQTFILGFAVFHSTIFACGWGGIYVSTDTGSTWSEINTGLPTSHMAHSLAIVGTDLFAGLDTNGIWKRPIGQIVSSVESKPNLANVGNFQLEQNFPNPFNPSTTISFSLAHDANVTLTIFDILGQEIQTLVSGHFAQGSHTINWDASGLPSGVYIYRIQAGNSVSARKMFLEK